MATIPLGDDSKDPNRRKKKPVRDGLKRRKHRNGPANPVRELLQNPRFTLLIACLWPLAILALFASSSPGNGSEEVSPQTLVAGERDLREHGIIIDKFEMRKVLDRIDVMGYGPTHPRVAFVVVGDTKEALTESVRSIFANTDWNRIFVVVAVLDDGKTEGDPNLVRTLEEVEKDSTPKHWQALKNKIHQTSDGEEGGYRSPKLHVEFHPERKGVAASRTDAADFVQILVRTHEDAGVKSPDEDIILLLLQGGSQFVDNHWLSEVTPALIVKPPLLELHNQKVAMKLANAISFHTEGPGKRTSFDTRLAPIVSDAPAADINMSSGKNFRAPAINGVAIAMRLGTFLNLPETKLQNEMDLWLANLDLSLNLWLCADGIDILENVEVISPEGGIYKEGKPMKVDDVAKLTSVWMDDEFRERFFQAYADEIQEIVKEGDDEVHSVNRVEWETALAKSKRLAPQLYKRCRTFEWYINEVNIDISGVLEKALIADHRFDPPEDHRAKEVAEEKAREEEAESARRAAAENQRKAAEEEAAAHIETPEKVPLPAHPVPPSKAAHIETPGKVSLPAPPASLPAPVPPPLPAQPVPPSKAKAETPEKRKPRKPLRPTNLEIVQRPKMVDISYVDVSGGHKQHPHMGALDADGKPGYVHDEKALRTHPPKFGYSEQELAKACAKRDSNFKMMHKRIVVEKEYDRRMNESGQKRDKIFCLVYTTEKQHDRIPNIRQTWGPKCDGFMVGSTKTDPSIDAVNIPHEGPEEYNNIWQKVRSMWAYIYDNYYEEYDWFHIGGDDLFLIVENLRQYLESEEIRTAGNGGIYLPEGNETKQTPLFLGRRFKYQGDENDIFNSGGSGYTMNKAAFKLLVTEGFPNYFPHRKTFSEDTMVATVLRMIDHIVPYDTKDDEGGERYMPFMPGHHLGYRIPTNPEDIKKDWYATYSIDIKEGLEHCSPQSVAFHYIKGDEMRRLFAIADGMCPSLN